MRPRTRFPTSHHPHDGVVLAQWFAMDHQVDPFTPDATGTPANTLSDTDDRLDRRRRRVVVNRAFKAIKAQHAADRSWMQTVAERLQAIAASTRFFVLHVVWFTVWILWNTNLLGLRAFDPFPFGLLTMVVSLEAIFLSIFVLMTQARESAIAELREEMSLQVSLRLEEEVTKTLQLVAGLYTRLGHKVGEDPELHEMLQPLDIAKIERELVLQIATARQPRRPDD